MIKITIPNNNILERKYIIDIIFDEFLGLEFEVVENIDCQDWIIELENRKSLTIKDTFFSKYPKDLEYLKLENIPSKIEELDIFAASFFMLTRWEEYVNKARDKHNRFPAAESLAYKNNFLDRPIVNEYVELLKNMLLELDENLKFKIHNYKLVLTHDVDVPFKFYSIQNFVRTIGGDLLKRGSISLFLKNISAFIFSKSNYKKDPYYTFDYLLDFYQKSKHKGYFFFMSGGKTIYDNFYSIDDSRIQEIIKRLKHEGHFIGIHPSYASYNNSKLLTKEKDKLENSTSQDIAFGRHHYLNFALPTTWQNWEEVGMQWDSTLGYADLPGFRCGVCYEYSVFDILNRKKLKLKEKPLIVMECTIFEERYLNLNYEESFYKIISNIDTVRKYNGEFVLLWHNDRLETKEQRELFKKVLEY